MAPVSNPLFAALTFVLLSIAPVPAVAQGGTAACTVVASGRTGPIPDYYAWETTFSMAPTTDDALRDYLASDNASARVFREYATRATSRARAIRRQGPTPGVPAILLPDTELAAAETVLLERDAMTRALPPEVATGLRRRVEEERQTLHFTVPQAGRERRTASGRVRCEVAVSGKDFPQLVPEASYWEDFFVIKGAIAARRRAVSGGIYDDDALALQRALPLPIDALREFYGFAEEAASRIAKAANDARAAGLSQDESRRHVDQVVLDARDHLLRTLPPEHWLVVRAAAEQGRAGHKLYYRSVH